MEPTLSPFSLRNIRLFIAFRIAFNARFYYPVFTILFLDYGLTIEQFSLLNTVWAVSIVCAEVPSGALADIFGRRTLLIATSIFMVSEMALIAFVPLGNIHLIFWAFFLNRVFSGLAEAMASGADEAIAYDTLAENNLSHCWPAVLSLQMRLKSVAGVVTAALGALVYDPNVVNRLLAHLAPGVTLTQQQTMRYPVYLTLMLAFLALLTTMLFTESGEPSHRREDGKGLLRNILSALRVTLRAGGWIFTTPFAFAIIACGMCFDHILRLLITMTSEYFRLIQLPEASFGVITAGLSLLGLVIPKLCERMVALHSPLRNMVTVFVVAIIGLFGLTGFFPYIGLVPMGLLFTAIMMVSFFTSHYLNLIAESAQRATILSFKGMAFNLAYGLIGVVFAMLMGHLRESTSVLHPEWTHQLVENTSFITAIGWSPWYLLVVFVGILPLLRRPLADARPTGEGN